MSIVMKTDLTPREIDVVRGIVNGRLNKQIAGDLGISPRTVEKFVSLACRKLGARNRTQAAVLAVAKGVV